MRNASKVTGTIFKPCGQKITLFYFELIMENIFIVYFLYLFLIKEWYTSIINSTWFFPANRENIENINKSNTEIINELMS